MTVNSSKTRNCVVHDASDDGPIPAANAEGERLLCTELLQTSILAKFHLRKEEAVFLPRSKVLHNVLVLPDLNDGIDFAQV